MITSENIERFKSYGFVLTPVHKSKNPNDDKKPLTPTGTWKYDWTDQELLHANRLGAYHAESNIYDIDFDDKSFRAHKFIDLLPPTLTIGKKVNGKLIATHKIYRKPDAVKIKPYSYPKDAKKHGKGNVILETLINKQTIIAGVDRVIINNVKPLTLDPSSIEKHLRMIVSFSELLKYWPEKNKGLRDEAHLRLAGALAKDTDVSLDVKEKFVERLCEITDDAEIKNRVNKLLYQELQMQKDPDKVYSVKGLSDFLNVNLPAFDEIKREDIKETPDALTATGLEFLNGHEFTIKDFPKPQYILWPIVAKQQIRQVFAPAGTGKTLMMLHEACAVASGHDFLHFRNEKQIKTPVLYVEGEMDSSSIQFRLNDIESAYERENKSLNKNFLFFATMALQKDMYFHSITGEIGRLNVEITAKKIEEITGIKPVIYLDNITALTVMQEKEGADWIEMMHWLSRLRNKGYHVTFLHHPTKTGETASGSNIKERSIDINMKLTTPDEKTIIEEREEGHTQIVMEFLKWREHMNTFHSKKRIAVLSRSTGSWEIFPMLNKTQRSIYQQLLAGKKADDIINPTKDGMSKANVYKVIKILKSEGVLKDEVSR